MKDEGQHARLFVHLSTCLRIPSGQQLHTRSSIDSCMPRTQERSTRSTTTTPSCSGNWHALSIDNRRRQCRRPPSQPTTTSPFPLAIVSSQRSIPLLQDYISPPFSICQTTHSSLISKCCSKAPCKTTRIRRAQHWPDILSQSNSRVVTQSTLFSPFYNSRHRPLPSFGEATVES
jgi:hypothetical protein